LLPVPLLTVRLTVYVPAEVYWCEGLVAVEVWESPKFHVRDMGEPVDASVNWTVSGRVPVRGGPVKFATPTGAAEVTTI
jgi:hypothetical protein